MSPQEQQDFADAKKLLKQRRYAQALPTLRSLANRHPEEGEIEIALNDCIQFGGQLGQITVGTPRATAVYQEEAPTTQAAPPGYRVKYVPISEDRYNLTYLAPLVGSIVLAVGVFLPWLNVGVASGLFSVEGSTNGIGSFSGSPLLGAALAKNPPVYGIDGFLLIGLAILALMVSLGGLSNSTVWAWKVGILFGLVAAGIAIYDTINFSSKVATINSSLGNTSTSASAAQVGPGLYVAAAGALVILVGSFAASSKASR